MKARDTVVWIIGIAILVLYLAGFATFHRFHGCLVSAATGELVFTVPDTTPYRLMRIIYAPLLTLSHERINPDPRQR